MLQTRRKFLLTTAGVSAGLGSAALLRTRSLLASAGRTDQALLAELAYGIFPHPRFDSALYRTVAERVAAQASSSPATSEAVSSGLSRVHALAGAQAGELDAAQRTAVLRQLQGGPFFNLLRSQAVQVLYRDPGVWNLIGYGGNAIARGGYLDSFNNIDWLPE